MSVRHWKAVIFAAAVCAAVASPIATITADAQFRGRDGVERRDPRVRGQIYRRQPPRGYQEPAFARGFADGYEEGLSDGRRRDRYDPVGTRDYRNGDQGYYRNYGSRDAYKNNYRAGFRQGYEEGYRDGR